MLSFLDYIDHYDLDLFIKEKNFIKSDKMVILSFRFINFFFKGLLVLEESNKFYHTKTYKNRFIKLLQENNIFFEELTFDNIYKMKYDFNLNKILLDCENKKNNMINKMLWIKIKKEDLKLLLINPKYQNNYKSIKEMNRLEIEDALYYYNTYIDIGKNEKKNYISII